MSSDKVYGTLRNADSVALKHGMVVRVSTTDGVVRAQADSSANLQGLAGIVDSGSVNVGGPVNVVADAVQQDVLLETGLTPVAGETLYVSDTVEGRATNVAPGMALAIGTIVDASQYSRNSLVVAIVEIPADARGASSGTEPVIESATGGVQRYSSNPSPALFVDIDPAYGDGITDNTGAINNWIASVPADQGARIRLPAGQVLVGSGGQQFNWANLKGIAIEGRARKATSVIAKSGATADLFTFTDCVDCSLSDLTIDAQLQRTAGFAVTLKGGDSSEPLSAAYPLDSNSFSLRRVNMHNQFSCLYVGNAAGPLSAPWLLSVSEGRWHHRDGYGIHLDASTPPGTASFGASHSFSRLFIYANPTSIATGAAVRITGTGDADFDGIRTFGTLVGLLMDPAAGGWVTSIRFRDSFFDSAQGSVARIAPAAGQAAFGDIVFQGVWFASSAAEHGFYIVTPAASNMRLIGCTFVRNNIFGAVIADGAENIEFDSCVFSSNTAGGFIATRSSVLFPFPSDFAIRNSRFLGDYGIGTITAQPLGWQVDAGCDWYIMANNHVHQCAVPFVDNGGPNKYVPAGSNL